MSPDDAVKRAPVCEYCGEFREKVSAIAANQIGVMNTLQINRTTLEKIFDMLRRAEEANSARAQQIAVLEERQKQENKALADRLTAESEAMAQAKVDEAAKAAKHADNVMLIWSVIISGAVLVAFTAAWEVFKAHVAIR